MKLFEIFESTMGRGADRSIEGDWRDQMAAQHAARTAQPTEPNAVHGFWVISREGKRLAGPFTSIENAERHKAQRRDRIPADAVVKKL